MDKAKEKINLFLKKIKEMPDFHRVKFVYLFGSYSHAKENKLSDIDFAVYYRGDKRDRFKFRIKLLGNLPDNFDVQIFQDLPLHVRMDVLKGKIIYSNDMTFAYDTAYETIKSFEHFKKYYYDYINTGKLRI
jgi:hypothetical protein